MKLKQNSILLIIFFSAISFAQNKYYVVNGGKIIDEKNYNEIKNNIAKYGKIEELNLKIMKKNDSIINYIKLGNLITTHDGIDPWFETKKFIGTKFPIEKYLNNESINFKNDYLEGKPTLINFWFTKCPPCIKELQTLNKLKAKYGDKVNFISITFENKKTVAKFLKKHEFTFEHITNSKKQISELNIAGYPTSIILDKNGIIKVVTPEITDYQINDIETCIEVLL